ncbi:MAG: fumarylacetoacetate hydrolase family protein [Micromonosporaceae bacterium]
MKLARIGAPGRERPAVMDGEGRWRDLSPVLPELTADPPGSAADIARRALAGGALPVIDAPTRFGPPVERVGKVVCIGLNYRDHAAETGAEIPAEPVVFLKAGDTVVGAYDEVLVPRNSRKTDWEVELAVVIGRTARYLPDEAAADACIAGYAISHDVSEREFQLERGGQWDKGKNCETFNPLGPWLVAPDEIADPQALGLRLWVNGDLRQDGSTKDMIFGVRHLVHYLSQVMVLYPGDVVNTGTPAGVALGTGAPYLKPGDVVELEIDGLGRQRQVLGAA